MKRLLQLPGFEGVRKSLKVEAQLVPTIQPIWNEPFTEPPVYVDDAGPKLDAEQVIADGEKAADTKAADARAKAMTDPAAKPAPATNPPAASGFTVDPKSTFHIEFDRLNSFLRDIHVAPTQAQVDQAYTAYNIVLGMATEEEKESLKPLIDNLRSIASKVKLSSPSQVPDVNTPVEVPFSQSGDPVSAPVEDSAAPSAEHFTMDPAATFAQTVQSLETYLEKLESQPSITAEQIDSASVTYNTLLKVATPEEAAVLEPLYNNFIHAVEKSAQSDYDKERLAASTYQNTLVTLPVLVDSLKRTTNLNVEMVNINLPAEGKSNINLIQRVQDRYDEQFEMQTAEGRNNRMTPAEFEQIYGPRPELPTNTFVENGVYIVKQPDVLVNGVSIKTMTEDELMTAARTPEEYRQLLNLKENLGAAERYIDESQFFAREADMRYDRLNELLQNPESKQRFIEAFNSGERAAAADVEAADAAGQGASKFASDLYSEKFSAGRAGELAEYTFKANESLAVKALRYVPYVSIPLNVGLAGYDIYKLIQHPNLKRAAAVGGDLLLLASSFFPVPGLMQAGFVASLGSLAIPDT